MPFTFSHPAAAVPLRRWLGRYGVLSALVIGSITPDLPYFFSNRLPGKASHSFSGLFWFCLPVGLIVYAFFHAILKRPLITLLPEGLRERITATTRPTAARPPNWIGVAISLVAGAATHDLWDAFTHFDGFVVLAIPLLQTVLFSVDNYHVRVYTLLQHGSTVAGLALLAFWFRQWAATGSAAPISPRAAKSPWRWRTAFIVAAASISLIVGAWIGALSIGERAGTAALKVFLRRASISGSITLALALVVYSAGWHLQRRRE
ncbi:MAG TPA: DUF4184 family protein [Terriglobia bacterium]|nr:DUF4184 family protein [Terriglobia bacterium]